MWKHNRWFGIAILAATMLATTGLSLAETPGPSARLIPSSQVTPVYPPAAFAARFDGEVILSAHIRADGTVGDIEVLESSRPKLGFEQASKDAVAQWQFQPAEVEGQAVESYAVFRLSFGVERGRDGQQSMVGGTAMESGLYGSGPSVTGAKGATTTASAGNDNASGNHSASAQLKRGVQKVKMPEACEGCLYDRRSLFPTAPEPVMHPN